jgi:hypothetical protein
VVGTSWEVAPDSAIRALRRLRRRARNHAVVARQARRDGRPPVGEDQMLTTVQVSVNDRREGLPRQLLPRLGARRRWQRTERLVDPSPEPGHAGDRSASSALRLGLPNGQTESTQSRRVRPLRPPVQPAAGTKRSAEGRRGGTSGSEAPPTQLLLPPDGLPGLAGGGGRCWGWGRRRYLAERVGTPSTPLWASPPAGLCRART